MPSDSKIPSPTMREAARLQNERRRSWNDAEPPPNDFASAIQAVWPVLTSMIETDSRDQGFETVVHLAARAGVRPSIEDPVLYSSVNLDGTTRLLQQLLSGLGVEADFVDTTDVAAVRAALRPATRLVFVETPANPTLAITDLAEVARIGKQHGVFTIADNTWASPYNQRPIELGIDAVNLRQTDWTGGLVTLFHRFDRVAFGWDAQQPREIAELVDIGIDGVFSDHVDRLHAVFSQFSTDRPTLGP